MSQSIRPGSRVTLQYTLTLENGLLVDSSTADQPLQFTHGDGNLHPGLENCLLGMQAGEHARHVIPPAQGFGQADPAAIQILPRSDFADASLLRTDAIIGFALPDGREIPGRIIELRDRDAVVDFNHPLAGQVLVFSVEIIRVET